MPVKRIGVHLNLCFVGVKTSWTGRITNQKLARSEEL